MIIDFFDWAKITNKYTAWCIKSKEKNKDLVISYHQTKGKYPCHQGVTRKWLEWLESDGWTSVQKFNYTISDSKETSANYCQAIQLLRPWRNEIEFALSIGAVVYQVECSENINPLNAIGKVELINATVAYFWRYRSIPNSYTEK